MSSADSGPGLDRRSVEVLATVAHEFRNALTPLKGYLSVLARDGGDPGDGPGGGAERGEGYRVMLRQADRLERLVGDLLAASTISSGRAPVSMETVDVAALVREQVEEARRGSGRTIALRVPECPAMATADPLRVIQVLANLLANAVRYSPAPLPISVTLAMSEDRVIVSVHDQGPGIAVEEQDGMFVAFGRSNGSADRSGGAGLGLFVSRTLVQAMGGRMWLVSRPGRGSTFSFSLRREIRAQ